MDVNGAPKEAQGTGSRSGSTSRSQDIKRATGSPSSVDETEDATALRRLRRRVDWRIVPITFLCYLFNFIDKVAYNYAGAMGMKEDLKLVGNDFSNVATAFFAAYLIAEFPMGFLLTKFSASKVLGINVVLWGIATASTAAAKDYRSLLASRIFLGIFEACVVPSLIMISSRWYTKSEQAPRFAFWYCGLGAGQIIGGFLSFGFQHATSSTFESWRIMFVVLGSVTVFLGLATVFCLSDSPSTAKFLSPAERDMILQHVSTEKPSTKFDPKQLWDAVKDPQLVLLALMTILPSISSGVVTSYSATLIRNFGYSPKSAALLNIPSGVVSIASTLIAGFGVRYTSYRWLWFIASCIPGMLGGALMSFLPQSNHAGLLAGIYLVNSIVPTVMLTYQFAAANTSGDTGRAFSATVMAFSFGIGNIVGPQTFRVQDAPQYLPAKITVLATQAVAALLAVVLFLYYFWSNKRKAGRYVY